MSLNSQRLLIGMLSIGVSIFAFLCFVHYPTCLLDGMAGAVLMGLGLDLLWQWRKS